MNGAVIRVRSSHIFVDEVFLRIGSHGRRKFFSRGAKMVKLRFTHSKLKKRPFLLKVEWENFKIQDALTLPPSDAYHESNASFEKDSFI